MDFSLSPSFSLGFHFSPHSIFFFFLLLPFPFFLSASPYPITAEWLSRFQSLSCGHPTKYRVELCYILLRVPGGVGRKRQEDSQGVVLQIQFDIILILSLGSFAQLDIGRNSLHLQESCSLLKSTCRGLSV